MIASAPCRTTAATYGADWIGDRRIIIAVQPVSCPNDDKFSVDVWELSVAEAILADKRRIAAEYDADAEAAGLDGRMTDAEVFKTMARLLLTQAADLAVAITAAGGNTDVAPVMRRAA